VKKKIIIAAAGCGIAACAKQEHPSAVAPDTVRFHSLSGASSDGGDGEAALSSDDLSPEELASKEKPTYPDELWHQVVGLYQAYEVERWADLPRDGLEEYQALIAPWKNDAPMDAELVATDQANRAAFDVALIEQDPANPQEVEELKQKLLGDPGITTYIGSEGAGVTP